jgi:Ca2+-binding RTX toxin-like protein
LYLVDSLADSIVEAVNQGVDSVLASISGYTLAGNVECLELAGSVVAGTGNSLANTLTGNAAGNSLDGGSGIDRLVGGDGNDTFFVDTTVDVVVEASNEGEDLVVSAVAGYTLAGNVEALLLSGAANIGTGNALDNTLTANATLGSSLYGGGGEDTFVGGTGNDWFEVDSTGDSVSGGAGVDSVLANSDGLTLGGGMEWLVFGTASTGYGNNSANTLIGNSLANTLDGGVGADSMAGGAGNDYYVVDNIGDRIFEIASGGTSDTVFVDVDGYTMPDHVENLVIGGTVASVTGNSAANILSGNLLNNTLDGGGGADTMAGREGNDYYIVDNVGDVVQELGGQGTDSILANVISYVLPNEVEVLRLGTNAVSGTGNSLPNTIIGNSSWNTIFGGTGNDWLSGGGGSDTLNGGAGDDTMVGGALDDWFGVDSPGDSIVGGGGTDGIIAGIDGYTLANGFANLAAGDGIFSVAGNAGNNTIFGNSLSNTLSGGAGDDTFAGGMGSDYYILNSAGDTVVEIDGWGAADTVFFSAAGESHTLSNFVERLILDTGALNGTGNSLRNTLSGNAGNNQLSGAGGNDSLFGDGGDDILTGATPSSTFGRGEIDTLTGGTGSDVFVLGTSGGALYNDAVSTNIGNADYALITDFELGTDRLQLRGTAAGYRLGAHTVSGLTAHQGLFLELGATDELIAIIQGSPIATIDSTTANFV